MIPAPVFGRAAHRCVIFLSNGTSPLQFPLQRQPAGRRTLCSRSSSGLQQLLGDVDPVVPVGVHKVAEIGFADSNVGKYNRGRPGYDSASLQIIDHLLQPSWDLSDPTRRLVEVGAGTGKFTQDFLAEYPQYRTNFLATEPSSAFRASLLASLGTADNLRAVEGYGESLPVASHSVCGVLAAQAFHWMANERTLRELHRVLKPGAPLVCVWNAQSRTVSWQAALEFDVIGPHYARDTPRQQDYRWRDVFLCPDRNQAARELFQSADAVAIGHDDVRNDHSPFRIHERSFTRTLTCSAQTIVDRALSVSVIACQPPAAQAAVETQVRTLLHSHPETRGVTNDCYQVQLLTELAWVYAKG